jgi:hypothetical protein
LKGFQTLAMLEVAKLHRVSPFKNPLELHELLYLTLQITHKLNAQMSRMLVMRFIVTELVCCGTMD